MSVEWLRENATNAGIVRSLAEKDAPVGWQPEADRRTAIKCTLCHQQVFADLVEGKGRDLSDPAEHLPTCPWRRAREVRAAL